MRRKHTGKREYVRYFSVLSKKYIQLAGSGDLRDIVFAVRLRYVRKAKGSRKWFL